jgi:glycosyltransferase involved in cell wall biosynthesis
MNIGISTSVIQRGRSGVAQYVFALVRSLLAFTKEHQFTLFVLEQDAPLFAFVELKMKIVRVPERYRSAVQNILWHQTTLPGLARQHRLDVLHVPSYRRMLWRKPCALVTTIHDLAPFHVPGKYDRARMFYGRQIVPRLARRQNEIIAVSQTTARDIAHFFKVPPERINMIYNGVDHGRFYPASRETAKILVARRHDLHQPFFLYIARLEHPGKNHVRLIEAFNRFKAETKLDWLLVFGGSDWHGAEVIRDAIRQSPYQRDIRCLGFISDNDLPMWYRAADVFVYPSLFEGFGLPPVEAMASGCPVISSTEGALGEVVENAAAVVDPFDIDSIKSQLAQLAGDESLRRQLIAAGLDRAKHFDWNLAAAATLDVYARAAGIPSNIVPFPSSVPGGEVKFRVK